MDGASAGGLTTRVLHMHPVMFWVLCLVLAGLAAAGFYVAFQYLRRARIMEDTPTSRIRSAAQGYVELDGRGELLEGEPIIAPLTGRSCTWFRYQIEEKHESRDAKGNRRTEWRTIDKAVSDNLFALVDDTGRCVVDPEGAAVTPSAKDTWYGNSARPLRGPVGGSSFFASGRYRYREERMHPGEPLYAIGEFKTVGGAGDTGDVGDDVRALLRSWKSDPLHMRRFDADGDGSIDVNEWEAARKAARAEVLKTHARRAASAGTNLMTRPSLRSLPYLLSTVPQDGLASRYRWIASGALVGFFLTGASAVWMLGVRLA